LLRFAPRLTPIASVLFFNELLTQGNKKLAACVRNLTKEKPIMVTQNVWNLKYVAGNPVVEMVEKRHQFELF